METTLGDGSTGPGDDEAHGDGRPSRRRVLHAGFASGSATLAGCMADERSRSEGTTAPQTSVTERVSATGETSPAPMECSNGIVYVQKPVDDMGRAINRAIESVAPEGGRIVLPPGRFRADTQVVLGRNNPAGGDNMPLVIRGAGGTLPKATTEDAGTTIEPTSAVGGPFVVGDFAHFVTIGDLTIANGPRDVDAIQMGLSGYCRQTFVDDVVVAFGSNHGINVGNFYGGGVSRSYAHGTAKGLRFKAMNAANVTNVAARRTNTHGAAITFEDGRGWNATMVYSESNQGGAIETAGTCREATIDGVYLENNNTGANAEAGIHLGNTSTATGDTSFLRLSGVRGAGIEHDYGRSRVLVEKASHVTLSHVRMGEGDLSIHDASNALGYQNHYFQCRFDNVDTSNDDPPELWSGCRIPGTVSKSGNAVTLIGD